MANNQGQLVKICVFNKEVSAEEVHHRMFLFLMQLFKLFGGHTLYNRSVALFLQM